ncbi:MAG TPA: sugar phosphate isomerase/epimerase [Armatimonadota bacterium]|nr:sugar phosphate isomerase/epimerase [Armatimonadota bacterium]
MFPLGANSVLFGGFDLETAMAHIAACGYDGIELSAIKGMCEHLNLDSWRVDVPRIRDLAQEHGLRLLAIEEAALDEARLTTCFEAAAALGIPLVNIGPGGKSDVEEDFRLRIELMAKMARLAADHGVILCAKAHVKQSIYSTPTTLRAMAEIDSPGFGIDMDPSHIYRAGEDPVEALRQVVTRIRHVHIRDCPDRGPKPGAPELQACGRGEIDLAGYVKVLVDARYTGPVDLEIIGAGEYELARCAIIAAESRGYLNACFRACGPRRV